MELTTNFLGRGWSFPPEFKKASGIKMTSDEEDIRRSLQILLSTTPGERIMQPTYGCNMKDLLFESLSTSMQTFMADKIKTAILLFEPRVITDKVELKSDNELDGVVLIEIGYTIITTNTRNNIVFPFYKNEGFKNA